MNISDLILLLLLLACPLAMFFMHRGGGHAGHGGDHSGGTDRVRAPRPPDDAQPDESNEDASHDARA